MLNLAFMFFSMTQILKINCQLGMAHPAAHHSIKCWSNGPGPSKQWIEMENVGLFQLQTMDGLKKQWMGSSSITPRNDSTSATHTHKNSPLGSTPPDIFINAIVTDHWLIFVSISSSRKAKSNFYSLLELTNVFVKVGMEVSLKKYLLSSWEQKYLYLKRHCWPRSVQKYLLAKLRAESNIYRKDLARGGSGRWNIEKKHRRIFTGNTRWDCSWTLDIIIF